MKETSSSIYNAMDQVDPVLDFDKYLADDERITDEVTVYRDSSTSISQWSRALKGLTRKYPLKANAAK